MRWTFLILAFSFCTGMEAGVNWSSPPTVLSSANQNASAPSLAIDGSGNLVAVWIENGTLYSKGRLVGGTWSSPADVLSLSGASSPQLVLDPNGNATVVWAESGSIKSSARLSGGSWSAITTLSSSGASAPQLGVDSSGNVVAIWTRNTVIESATKLFAGGWPILVDTLSGMGADSPQIGVGSNGNIVAVWHVAGTPDKVYASRKIISGLWSAALSISSPTSNCVYPSIAVDPSGNAYVGWFSYNVSQSIYSNVIAESASQPLNGSWTTPVNISSPSHLGVCNPSKLLLKMGCDKYGNVIALWTNSDDGNTFIIHTNIMQAGGSWMDTQDLILDNLYAFSTDLAVDTIGYTLVAYMYYDFPTSSLIIQTTGTGINALKYINFWDPPLTISTDTPNGYPKVATALAGGTTHISGALWLNSNGTNNILQAVTGTEAEILPPTNLSLNQQSTNWGLFTEYYNTLSWQQSASPNAIGYLIQRNGLLIGQVDQTSTQFIDHNRDPNIKDTYAIVTLDDDQDQSILATITLP